MTNNFKPKKGGYQKPQLSPDEWKEKKQAEKDAVYQMIDDTASSIIQDGEKSRHFLILRQGLTDTPPQMLCLSISSIRRQPNSRTSMIGQRKKYLSVRVQKAFQSLNLLSTPRMTAQPESPTM